MSNQKGYDPNFLGASTVPLPSFSASLRDDVLELSSLSCNSGNSADNDGPRIYRHYHNYTICMSRKYKTALFAALNINQSLLLKTDKTVSGFRIDDEIGKDHQLNGVYYGKNEWDRGHLAADCSAGWGETEEDRVTATNDTYYYTNATLQHENFNRDEWKDLELYVRSLEDDSTDRLSEITGPIFNTSGETLTVSPPGRELAVVPAGFFKVVAYINSQNSLAVRCFIIYQDANCLNDRDGVVDHKRYQVSVREIENLTGLVFDPVYHKANVIVADDHSDAPPHHDTTDPSNVKSGILIAAAMGDPAGKDSGNEWISIVNNGNEQNAINLSGWKLVDQKGRTLVLNEELLVEHGQSVTLQPISPLRLVNSSGSLTLFNISGDRVDQVQYSKEQVKEGIAVDFLKKQ